MKEDKKMERMTMKDDMGRRRDCHFCMERGTKITCTALEEFYNETDKTDLCGKCPFFKTETEFWDGWRRRGRDEQADAKKAV